MPARRAAQGPLRAALRAALAEHVRPARAVPGILARPAAAARQASSEQSSERGPLAMLPALGAGGGLALASSSGRRSARAGDSSRALTRNFVADAAGRAVPAVASITAGIGGGSFFAASGLCAGSGSILRPAGLAVTNAHVVEGASNGAIVCTLNDGRKFTGRVKSLDRGSDVALVQIEEAPTAGGHDRVVRHAARRQQVVALGPPLTLQNSCTAGIASALARHGSEIGMAHGRTDCIQTDAAINVGNSGGPFVNLDGAVVRISTLKAQGTDGIGFAIPIDAAWLRGAEPPGAREGHPAVRGHRRRSRWTSRSRWRRRGHPTAKGRPRGHDRRGRARLAGRQGRPPPRRHHPRV